MNYNIPLQDCDLKYPPHLHGETFSASFDNRNGKSDRLVGCIFTYMKSPFFQNISRSIRAYTALFLLGLMGYDTV
jgi:hypothetical protein